MPVFLATIVSKVTQTTPTIKRGGKGTETWIALPREAWPSAWFDDDGDPLYEQPDMQLLRALYVHPDAGTFWEHHCDDVIVKQIGFEPVETCPPCCYHSQWQLRLTV